MSAAPATADEIGTLPCGWVVTGKNGEPHKAPAHPILAHGKVRHVGDPVAMIVAETYEQAQHAADLIAIDYKVLPAVVDPAETTDAGAPLLHEEAPGNICYDWDLGDKAGVDTAFEAADHVVKLNLRNNRTAAVPIETRAAVAPVVGHRARLE